MKSKHLSVMLAIGMSLLALVVAPIAVLPGIALAQSVSTDGSPKGMGCIKDTFIRFRTNGVTVIRIMRCQLHDLNQIPGWPPVFPWCFPPMWPWCHPTIQTNAAPVVASEIVADQGAVYGWTLDPTNAPYTAVYATRLWYGPTLSTITNHMELTWWESPTDTVLFVQTNGVTCYAHRAENGAPNMAEVDLLHSETGFFMVSP